MWLLSQNIGSFLAFLRISKRRIKEFTLQAMQLWQHYNHPSKEIMFRNLHQFQGLNGHEMNKLLISCTKKRHASSVSLALQTRINILQVSGQVAFLLEPQLPASHHGNMKSLAGAIHQHHRTLCEDSLIPPGGSAMFLQRTRRSEGQR